MYTGRHSGCVREKSQHYFECTLDPGRIIHRSEDQSFNDSLVDLQLASLIPVCCVPPMEQFHALGRQRIWFASFSEVGEQVAET
jgi:hypothetical protein